MAPAISINTKSSRGSGNGHRDRQESHHLVETRRDMKVEVPSRTTSTTSSISDSSEASEDKKAMFETKEGYPGTTSRLLEVKFRKRWEIQDSILDTIGQTPIVQLQRMAPLGVDVFVKMENMNPGGSSKDRMALGVIEWAEATGMLHAGQTVVETSSGNSGIALAMVCAALGYKFVCVMRDSSSPESRKLVRLYGAKIILTKSEHQISGTMIKAQELADKHGFFYPKQFESEANCWIHEHTTGWEICKAFTRSGRALDHFFMAYGTGGTVLGIARAFKKHKMTTKIHVCEPANAPMLSSGIETKYLEDGGNSGGSISSGGTGHSSSVQSAHPMWSRHLLQCWAPDFIPKLIATAKSEGRFHAISQVASLAAVEASRELAIKEGIFTGISGGGILAAALAHAKGCKPGTTILCILPDTGERYLSSPLFEDPKNLFGPSGMTAEEQALSDTTAGHFLTTQSKSQGFMPEDTDQLFDL